MGAWTKEVRCIRNADTQILPHKLPVTLKAEPRCFYCGVEPVLVKGFLLSFKFQKEESESDKPSWGQVPTPLSVNNPWPSEEQGLSKPMGSHSHILG